MSKHTIRAIDHRGDASRPSAEQAAEALGERLLGSARSTLELFGVYLGDQLGYYELLSQDGPLSAAELARRSGTHPRYAREWLEHQATLGILGVDDARADADTRGYRLPAGHERVLADAESLDYLAPLAQLVAGVVKPLPQLLEAYRSGAGVPFEAYGPDARLGQARMNRNMLLQQLGHEWLPSVPELDARLRRAPAARVADLGCGLGWSSIGVASAYPLVEVDGYDLDSASVEEARVNAQRAGLAGRVRFERRNVSEPELAGRYQLALAVECLHDMARPLEALRSMRRLLAPDGVALVVDERVGESFAEPGELDALMYGWSVLHCLPAGMAGEHSSANGTVLRPDTLRRLASEAGFGTVELLPVENPFFNFYLLCP